MKLVKKEADRFLTATEVSKVHAQFGEGNTRKIKIESKEHEDEFESGCFQVAFKSQLKNLSHVVTFQSELPLSSSEASPNPLGYFEVKILSLETKELS